MSVAVKTERRPRSVGKLFGDLKVRPKLDADRATQQGDREHEIVDENLILDDEIGQNMRSRNATILQLRRHEEALEDALRKLEAQDRLVSLGLLSASVAHELNTPLAVLQGSIEKLVETAPDAHTVQRLERMLRVNPAAAQDQRRTGRLRTSPQAGHRACVAAAIDR